MVRILKSSGLRILLAVGTIAVALLTFFSLRPELAPWVDTATLVLYVRSVPSFAEDAHTLGIGFDVLRLTGTDTHSLRPLMRRVQLSQDSHTLFLVIEAEVPVGTYDGIRFSLKSPELRNDWQTDSAPNTVLLAHEEVAIPFMLQFDKDEHHTLIIGFETSLISKEGEAALTYLPVVQIEHRKGASTSVVDRGFAVTGGTLLHSGTYGMDWDGRMRYNFRAPSTPPLEDEAPDIPLPVDEGSTNETVVEEGEVEELGVEEVAEEEIVSAPPTSQITEDGSLDFGSDTLIE